MLFNIFELYCKDVLGTTPWDALYLTQQAWCKIKSKKKMMQKHYRRICEVLKIETTVDEEALSQLIFNLYWLEKNNENT